MRLIDATELKKELSNKEYITYTHEFGDAIPFDWIMNAIDNALTIEPTFGLFKKILCDECDNRPKGHWIHDDFKGVTAICSECYCINLSNHSNFCPNCGADMRGDNNAK
jgi:hypothetical protein